MGFIPIFLTMGGACLLFFLTVRNTMQRKWNRHHELFQELKSDNKLPASVMNSGSIDELVKAIKGLDEQNSTSRSKAVLRELKVNRMQFNQLIKKAPYNWVAKISGFQAIS